MNENQIKATSKFLSYVLRHAPEAIQLQLDENGWANVGNLITRCNAHNQPIDLNLLQFIVINNEKKRFAFNEDKTKIRASQGHSIEVDLEMKPVEPPTVLYHGTIDTFIASIKETGLQKMTRQHVHLSADKNTATKVGSRRGKPVILTVNSGSMFTDGILFYLSQNGVWLCDAVPPKYIDF